MDPIRLKLHFYQHWQISFHQVTRLYITRDFDVLDGIGVEHTEEAKQVGGVVDDGVIDEHAVVGQLVGGHVDDAAIDVVAFGEDPLPLLAHDDGGAGVLAARQDEAGRRHGVLQEARGDESVVAARFVVFEDVVVRDAQAETIVEADIDLNAAGGAVDIIDGEVGEANQRIAVGRQMGSERKYRERGRW